MGLVLVHPLQTFVPIKDAKQAEIEKPKSVSPPRAYIGIATAPEKEGVRVTDVAEESPAEAAGLLKDDVILAIGDAATSTPAGLRETVRAHKPGEKETIRVRRGGEEIDLAVTFGEGAKAFFKPWSKPKFRMAVVLVEFSDVKHNPKLTKHEFWRMMFSKGEYTGRNATGEDVFGSLRDYYFENSYGKLDVTGRVFGWYALGQSRDYFESKSMGGKAWTREFLGAMIDQVKAAEGDDVFDDFDGLVIFHAGDQSHNRPMALWPHQSDVRIGKRTMRYLLSSEGGKFMASIGVHCHEFGHMIGLPDQYGSKHATGVGKWCVMSVGHMGGGESHNHRPYHLCAWCKAQLGWVKPAVLDPRDAQHLRLDPVEKDPTAVGKILIQPDGSEYYLVENRQRIGFDSDLDGTGMLIWRVAKGGGVDLVEGHGHAVKNASLVETDEVPFPNSYNRHFTPDTFPSSLGKTRGGREIYLKEIRADDRAITFTIGEFFEAETWEPPEGQFH